MPQADKASLKSVQTFAQIDIECPIEITKPSDPKSSIIFNSPYGNYIYLKSLTPATSGISIQMSAATLSSSIKKYGYIYVGSIGSETNKFANVTFTAEEVVIGIVNAEQTAFLPGANVFADGSIYFDVPSSLELGGIISAGTGLTFASPLTITGDTTLKVETGTLSIRDPIISTTSGLNLNLDSRSNSLTIKSLGTEQQPLGALSINATNLNLNGNLITNSSIDISCPISILVDAINIKAPGGITLQGAVSTTVANSSLSLDAGSSSLVVSGFASTVKDSLGSLSWTCSSLYLGGVITTERAINFTGPVRINKNCTLQASEIVFSQAIVPNEKNLKLTLNSSSGIVSLQNLGTSEQSLGTISITSAQTLDIAGNLLSSGEVILNGSSIKLGADVIASTFSATSSELFQVVNLGTNQQSIGTISITSTQALNITGNLFALGAVTLSGSSITLGNNVTTSGTITITNSAILTIPSGTWGAGSVIQTGSGNVFLGGNITTTGLMSFAGPITLTTNTNLTGKGGITFSNSIVPEIENVTLTVDAGTSTLKIANLGSDESHAGALNITAAKSLDLQGNLLTNSSLTIPCPITLSGTSSKIQGSGIDFKGAVTVPSTNFNLTLDAGPGLLNIPKLGTQDKLLASLSLQGSSLSLGGDIYTNGPIEFDGPVSIGATSTLQGSEIHLKNISASSPNLDVTLTSDGAVSFTDLGTDTQYFRNVNINSPDLNVGGNLLSSGNVTLNGSSIKLGADVIASNFSVPNSNSFQVVNLGTDKKSIGTISITNKQALNITGNLLASGAVTLNGSSITLGNNVTTPGTINITNSAILTIPSGTWNSGSLIQTGSGNVFLGGNITTTGLMSFAGLITLTTNTNLTGKAGITFSNSIVPEIENVTLTLDAGTSNLTIANLGSDEFHAGALNITAAKSLDLKGNLLTNSSLTIPCPITLSGTSTKIQGSGIDFKGAVTVQSKNFDLILDAGPGLLNIPKLGTQDTLLASLSLQGSSLSLGGGIYTNGPIGFEGPLSIGAASTLQGSEIHLKNISASSPNLDVTLTSVGAVSFTDLGTDTQYFRNVTVNSPDLNVGGSLLSSGTVTLSGSSIKLGADVIASNFSVTNSDSFQVVNLGTSQKSIGTISITNKQALNITGNLFASGAVTLSGSSITLGNNVTTPGTITIANSDLLLIPPGTWSVGSLIQTGFYSVSLAANMSATKSIAFEGAITVSAGIALKSNTGLSLNGPIIPGTGNPSLTLNAGNAPISLIFKENPGYEFGALDITGVALNLQGNVSSVNSIRIDAPITISEDTTFSSLGGYNGINFLKPLNGSKSYLAVTLNAKSGPVNVQSLGNSNYPLGFVSMSGNEISLAGDVVSTGAIEVNGPITISSSLKLRGDAGITLHQDLGASTDPFDITLQAVGPIEVQNLGTNQLKLGNISVTSDGSINSGSLLSSKSVTLSGSTITLGSQFVASESVTIQNTESIYIPSGTFNLTKNFTQTGPGPISLGVNIQTKGSISFEGPMTVTNNTVLQGSQGITLPSVILPDSSDSIFTLNAGDTTLKIQSLGSAKHPFKSLNITAKNLELGGDIYTQSSLLLSVPIKIFANASIYSSNYQGIALLQPVTVPNGSDYSLGLFAEKGPLEVLNTLGSSNAPLGNVTLTGTEVTLNGNIFSNQSIGVNGNVTIQSDITLTGSLGVTVSNSLLPSTGAFSLNVQSLQGVISLQSLGNSKNPLKNVYLTGMVVGRGGPIVYTNLLTITTISESAVSETTEYPCATSPCTYSP